MAFVFVSILPETLAICFSCGSVHISIKVYFKWKVNERRKEYYRIRLLVKPNNVVVNHFD